MQYTKGNWKVISAEFTEKGVAYEVIMPKQEICIANAHLIAQSPRMADLLERLINDGWNASISVEAVEILDAVEGNKCPWCGNTEEVLSYYAKVGGSDEAVLQVHCKDLDKCLERREQCKNQFTG